MMKSILILLIVVVQCSFAEPITLMTFNIRYGTANDGENSWEYRKEHVVETIRDANPSAIAIQEALLGQLEYLIQNSRGIKKLEYIVLEIQKGSLVDYSLIFLYSKYLIKGKFGFQKPQKKFQKGGMLRLNAQQRGLLFAELEQVVHL